MLQRCVLLTLSTLLWFSSADLAEGQATLQVLVDSDNLATGCLVSTADGAFDGVDAVLTVQVDPAGGQVGPSMLEECEGGGFGAPLPVDGAVWPLGEGSGVGGSDLAEFRYPLDAFKHGSLLRVGFVSCTAGDALLCDGHTGSTDALLTRTGMPGGNGLFVDLRTVVEIPTVREVGLVLLALLLAACTLRVLRREPHLRAGMLTVLLLLSVGNGLLWAAVLLDGLPDDWVGVSEFASDPEADAPDVDLVAAFVQLEGESVFFRLDALVDVPPAAADDTAVRLEDDLPTAIDVLANDLNPDGGPMLIESVTQPAAGFVEVTGGGTGLTYAPDADACNDGVPTDDFTYTLSPGGSMATVRVEVVCVNDPPSFLTAGDLLVDMNAGTNSGVNELVGWVSDIQPGPANEAGQSVSFLVTSSNPELFVVQPAVSASGDLSFTTASRAIGVATITVVAIDNGGTANGGDDSSASMDSEVDVSCTVVPPADYFSGPYLMQQLSGLDPFYAAETFGDTQVVNLVADGFRRSFDFLYYPGIFDADYNFTMYLCGGEISVVGSINSDALGCGGANIGFATGSPAQTYDPAFPDPDDAIMLVDVADFEPDGNCETGSYPVELRFTEQ